MAVAMAADKAPEPAPALIEVAHSAQLLVAASESHDAVSFWIRRASDKKLIDGKDVTVSIAGKNQVVTHRTDGSYSIPTDELSGKEAKPVELIVGHDGIRELLEGQLPPPAETSGTGLLGGHNQLAWWIINIGVVLIGVIALSRKKSY
jgi:hypothetical protein